MLEKSANSGTHNCCPGLDFVQGSLSLSLSLSLPLSSAGHTCCSNFVVAAVVMVIVGQVHNLTFSQPLELRCWVRLHSFVLYAAVALAAAAVVVIVVVAVDRMPPSVRSGKRH